MTHIVNLNIPISNLLTRTLQVNPDCSSHTMGPLQQRDGAGTLQRIAPSSLICARDADDKGTDIKEK